MCWTDDKAMSESAGFFRNKKKDNVNISRATTYGDSTI